MPVCTKMISSRVGKVLCVANPLMSLRVVHSVVSSVALVASVFLVPILQASDWAKVSTPAKHYFSTYFTSINQHQDSLRHVVLGLSE